MKFFKIKPLFFIIATLSIIMTFMYGTAFCTEVDNSSERILSYDSKVFVNKDSSITVTENIRVKSEGENIKHGIYRDFPTKYTDKKGTSYNVGFKVLSVKKDEVDESYRIESMSNGKRIYIGKSDVFLSPGEYIYTLEYETTRQMGFFQDHDELYWNVTGNGWAFPIDKASARVFLPSGIAFSEIKQDAFTGSQGLTEKNYTCNVINGSELFFQTTSPLKLYEGLTIVVGWPKGFIEEPSPINKSLYFLRDNFYIFFLILAILILFLFYFIAWIKLGKDPAKGTIIPLYSPPEGFSPAALRYIKKMQADNKTFATAIINMAVKGTITITEEKVFLIKKVFTITKTQADTSILSDEEKRIYKSLFSRSNSFIFDQKDYSTIQSAINSFSNSLKTNFQKKYFTLNGLYTSIGFFYIIALGIIVKFLTPQVFPYESIGILIIAFILMIVINVIFTFLMKAPTLEGRKLLDIIEGFKMYLSYAEKDELNFSAPAEKTPELFEKYLPYALALDVENQWAEKFSDVLSRAVQEENYHPAWYYGSSLSALSLANFGSSLGNSLTESISSSSTAPGSSSGFSGGSSGGGGGGGGGGGW